MRKEGQAPGEAREAIPSALRRAARGLAAAFLTPTVAGLLTVFPLAPASTVGQAAADSKPAEAALRDTRLTLEAREALSRDYELARETLGVQVRDGVATVWGRVATARLSERTLEVLGRVKGLKQVRSELTVVAADEVPPAHPASRVGISPPPEAPKPVSRLPHTPGQLLGRDDGLGPAQSPFTPQPAGLDRQRTVTLLPPLSVVDGPAPAEPESPALLLRPQARPTAVPTSAPHAEDPVALLRPRAARPTPALGEAIERIRLSEPRFATVTVAERGGIVYLYGPGDGPAALGERLARLPGVARIVLVGEAPDLLQGR